MLFADAPIYTNEWDGWELGLLVICTILSVMPIVGAVAMLRRASRMERGLVKYDPETDTSPSVERGLAGCLLLLSAFLLLFPYSIWRGNAEDPSPAEAAVIRQELSDFRSYADRHGITVDYVNAESRWFRGKVGRCPINDANYKPQDDNTFEMMVERDQDGLDPEVIRPPDASTTSLKEREEVVEEVWFTDDQSFFKEFPRCDPDHSGA